MGEEQTLKPACGCAKMVQASLAELNTTLVTTLFTGQVLLRTEKTDTRKRGRAIAVVASFCPFCGAAYVAVSKLRASPADEVAHGH